MNERRTRFVEHLMVLGNAEQAYIEAGYAPRGARANAARLIANDSVATAIVAAQAARAERTKIDADWVLTQAVEVAERCMKRDETFDAVGAMRALTLIARHTGGFSERHELTGPGGEPIPVDLRTMFATLTPEQLGRLADGHGG